MNLAKFVFVTILLISITGLAAAQTEDEASSTESVGSIERGKELAEQYIIDPTKKVTQRALSESKPIIEKIGELLIEKLDDIEERIAEDKEKSMEVEEDPNLAAAAITDASFYEELREKLPPVFRILYSWLLKFLILVFSVWWIPLIIGILVVMRILLGVYRRVRYR